MSHVPHHKENNIAEPATAPKREFLLRRLGWVLALNLFFLLVEIAGGIISQSLALLADAGHMATDVLALSLALFMAYLAKLPPTPRRTFGLARAEVLGAFINGSLLVLIVGLILWEAWRRLGQPVNVNGPLLLVVAGVGLAVNFLSAALLFKHRGESLNLKGAFLHMAADALGSLSAIVAGAIIILTAWNPIDALASVGIAILILWSSLGLLRETMNVLLNATPEHIDYEAVRHALASLEHVEEIHDLHIWTIASGMPALSVHLRLHTDCCDSRHWQDCLRNAQELLRVKFGIVHSTLQLEPMDYCKDGRSL